MPSVRLGWQADPRNFLWAAISRAVRSPSRLERDLTAPGIVNTSPDFQSEKLIAYEAGWRSQLTPRASVSLSLFYNDYSDLRTTSPKPVTVLPITFGNGWEGHTYGVDAWGSYSPLPWWRLNPGFGLLRKDFHLKPGESRHRRHADGARPRSGAPGVSALVHGPAAQHRALRRACGRSAALSDVDVPSYFEADVRLGWRVTPALEFSLDRTQSRARAACRSDAAAHPRDSAQRLPGRALELLSMSCSAACARGFRTAPARVRRARAGARSRTRNGASAHRRTCGQGDVPLQVRAVRRMARECVRCSVGSARDLCRRHGRGRQSATRRRSRDRRCAGAR